MDNALQKMQEMVSGFDARINRLRAELESAEKERTDVQTAIRVLISVSGSKPPPLETVKADVKVSKTLMRPPSERRKLILEELGTGERNGRQPVHVFNALYDKGIVDMDIATLRTALWRMAKKGEIGSGDSRYWILEKKPESLTQSDLLG